MPSAKPPRDFFDQIVRPFDGIETIREARAHSRDKLAILSYYLPQFAKACSRQSKKFYFVDAVAGPGLYHFADRDEYALGSTLIALDLPEHPFTKVLSVESRLDNFRALQTRTAKYGDRAVVERGDCNEVLMSLMTKHVPTWAPVLVLVDPNAFEASWDLVTRLAAHRTGGKYKTELLILVATLQVSRAHSGQLDEEGLPLARSVNNAFPPRSQWDAIVRRQLDVKVAAHDAREEIARDYAGGLQNLGYPEPFSRAITRPGRTPFADGDDQYHLVFASTNPAGHKIMGSAFKRMHTNLSKQEEAVREVGTDWLSGFGPRQ